MYIVVHYPRTANCLLGFTCTDDAKLFLLSAPIYQPDIYGGRVRSATTDNRQPAGTCPAIPAIPGTAATVRSAKE